MSHASQTPGGPNEKAQHADGRGFGHIEDYTTIGEIEMENTNRERCEDCGAPSTLKVMLPKTVGDGGDHFCCHKCYRKRMKQQYKADDEGKAYDWQTGNRRSR
jgi:hypothetical protein